MSRDVPPLNANDKPDEATLPDDLVVLKRMIVELLATLREREQDCEQLRHRLDQLLRKVYGAKAERWDPNQPALLPELHPDAASDNPPSPPPTPPADDAKTT